MMRQVTIGEHIKSYARETLASLYHASQIHRARHRGRVLILTYHRVLTQYELQKRYVQPGMYVLDHVFEQHMQFLQDHFQMLSFGELVERWIKKTWDRVQRY